jgi:hypothetical protein
MVIRVLALCLASLALAQPAMAEPDWLPREPLSATDQDSSGVDVAVDAQGNAVAVWAYYQVIPPPIGGAAHIIQASTRPAGGDWSAPENISGFRDGQSATDPRVAINARGDAAVVWRRAASTFDSTLVTFVTTRPAGGNWSTPDDISKADDGDAFEPQVAIDAAGGVDAVWRRAIGANTVFEAAHKPAGAGWDTAIGLSDPSHKAFEPQVAVSAAGRAVAVWRDNAGSADSILRVGRAAGQPWILLVSPPVLGSGNTTSPRLELNARGDEVVGWSKGDGTGSTVVAQVKTKTDTVPFETTPTTLSSVGDHGVGIDVAIDPQGRTLAGWQFYYVNNLPIDATSNRRRVQVAQGDAATKQWGPLEYASSDGVDSEEPQVALDSKGGAVAVWRQSIFRIMGSAKPPGGAWATPTPLSLASRESRDERLAADPEGNAAAVWRENLGSPNYAIAGAGFDGAPPRLTSTRFPATGQAGTALPFSASTFDVWSPVTTAWSFGDGIAATGTSVTHAYGRGGVFGPRVTATDAVGNSATATGSVNVASLPGSGADGTPPSFRGNPSAAPRTFEVDRTGAAEKPVAAAAKKGTSFSYSLSEAATVTFTVERRSAGRRVGRRCAKPTRRNRGRRKCSRYVRIGAFAHAGKAGANSKRFSGRIGRKALKPGRYRARLVARDAAGNKSAPKLVSFRVVRARKRRGR